MGGLQSLPAFQKSDLSLGTSKGSWLWHQTPERIPAPPLMGVWPRPLSELSFLICLMDLVRVIGIR